MVQDATEHFGPSIVPEWKPVVSLRRLYRVGAGLPCTTIHFTCHAHTREPLMDDLLLETQSGRLRPGMAGKPIVTSRGRPWKGFVVREQGPTNVEAHDVVLLKHLVCLQTEQPAQIDWQGDGRCIRRTILPGQTCVFPANRLHSGSFRHEGRHIVVELDPELLTAAMSPGRPVEPIELKWEIGIDSPTLRELVRMLHSEAGRTAGVDPQYAATVARLMALHLVQYHSTRTEGRTRIGGLTPSRLNRVVDLIRTHLGERLTLEQLARHAGLSLFHFARAFRDSTGMSPMEYVMHCRIAHARELLAQPGARIGDVALRCGFCDQAHFSRNFKRLAGITPAVFMRRILGSNNSH